MLMTLGMVRDGLQNGRRADVEMGCRRCCHVRYDAHDIWREFVRLVWWRANGSPPKFGSRETRAISKT